MSNQVQLDIKIRMLINNQNAYRYFKYSSSNINQGNRAEFCANLRATKSIVLIHKSSFGEFAHPLKADETYYDLKNQILHIRIPTFCHYDGAFARPIPEIHGNDLCNELLANHWVECDYNF